jgi:hypothetical protein
MAEMPGIMITKYANLDYIAGATRAAKVRPSGHVLHDR